MQSLTGTISVVSLLSTGMFFASPAAAEQKSGQKPRGAQIFYRMVGSEKNAPVLPKTRSIWTQDRRIETGTTGMADEGYTEFPFCYGVMDFTFAENWSMYPRLISGAPADETHVNTADMLIDRVYEPQASVWGWSGHEFIQTFTATGPELVRISLRMRDPSGLLRAALIEGGPGGKQIGPVRTFSTWESPAGGWPGSMEYSTARWEPAQAPLIPGQTYGIRLWRADGKPMTPYLHGTGNAYDGGILYVDQIPHPASDMALWIVEETPDLRRAVVEGADENGWVYNTTRVEFVPRTPNIRLITLNLSPLTVDPPTEHNCCNIVVRVWSKDGKPLAGPKSSLSCDPAGAGDHIGHALYATDELKVTPGEKYWLDAYVIPYGGKPLPDDQVRIKPRDINARIYGEPEPGAMPTISNLRAEFVTESTLRLSWVAPVPASTVVQTWGPGVSGNKTFEVPAGATEITIPKLWQSHWYNYQLTATGPTGLTWRTPIYRIRMPKEAEGIKAEVYQDYNKHLLALAPISLISAPDYPPLRYQSEVKVINNGFEDGLTGWTASPEGRLETPNVSWESTAKSKAKDFDLGTRWGDRMAGFTHVAGRERHEVREESWLTQRIPTTPGHVYVLAAGVNTTIAGGADGDTRVRLFADPTGGDNYRTVNHNSSQWYWTGGQWMRFQHQWRAESDRATIGFGFFRRQDLDLSSAYVDNVWVYDLGPSPIPADTAPALRPEPARLVLVDPKVEADDQVEGFVQAPPGYVITGLGARAHEDNITTMWARIQPLMPDGSLGPAEYIRDGYQMDNNLEAKVELPEGYVVTGFGAGIAPEWDVKRFGVWARPLSPDGSLGEERLFRDGVDLTSGFEKEVKVGEGRVLTAAGFNCMFNDVNGIKAMSAAIVPSASAKAK